MNNRGLNARVALSDSQLEVCIEDTRADSLNLFEDLNDGQRAALSMDAWNVGLRALMSAYRQAEEAKLSDIGKSLAEGVDEQLRAHSESQEKALRDALGRYFNPQDGELQSRLGEFLGNSGVLVSLLEKHLHPQNSVLASTLTKHIGEESALFKKLSTTDSEGLIHLLGEKMRSVLEAEHSEFTKALDPLQKDGAVGRFIESLREEMKRANDDQDEQLKIALQALDTTKEDSLLNQMRRETEKARSELLRAINPDAENSPLAIIKTSLTTLLSEHVKTMQQQLEAERKENAEHRSRMQESIQRIEARKREELRSNRGGAVFEDSVAEFIQQLVGRDGYIVDTTGNVTGLRPNCKVGDLTIGFPREHAFAEARVVVEAKRDKSYTVTQALQEIGIARENRSAQVGIFVMAVSHAPSGFQTFGRYGKDILVLWNDEDPSTDAHLQAAIMVGLALAQRTQCAATEGDVNALQGVEQRLVKELERLTNIKKAADSIAKQAETIQKEVAVGESKLKKILLDAKSTLTALNVELHDEALEAGSPIAINAVGVSLERESANDVCVGA